ncbi:MAG: hypothetical protein RIS54_1043 [Verrucomicrobiota bacterium]
MEQSGIEELTLVTNPQLPPPPDPRKGSVSYFNNPLGLIDLHVVPVRFSGSRDCWMQHVLIKNAGQHPLILESSAHLTINEVELDGAYNKGAKAGSLLISGSESCLIDTVTVTGIARVVFD